MSSMTLNTTPNQGRAERRRRADGERSRRTILDAAARLATVEGIEGLSIGGLAQAIGMSKSGLYAHFGSKEELQLATIGAAQEVFDADVINPALRGDAVCPRRGAVRALPLARRARRLPRRLLLRVGRGGTRHPAWPARDRIAAIQASWAKLIASPCARPRTSASSIRTRASSGSRSSSTRSSPTPTRVHAPGRSHGLRPGAPSDSRPPEPSTRLKRAHVHAPAAAVASGPTTPRRHRPRAPTHT